MVCINMVCINIACIAYVANLFSQFALLFIMFKKYLEWKLLNY